MSLFDIEALNASEFQRYFSAIDKDYRPASLASFLLQAETNYLVPAIGQQTYDQINTKYADGTGTDAQKALLVHLQSADLHLALMLSSTSGSFSIADSGYYVSVSGDRKPVSDKKLTEFKAAVRETGYQALENAVLFLEQNIDLPEFADYKSSDQHIANQAYFINNSRDITKAYKKFNNSAYLFSQITDSLAFAERRYILPVLGKTLFTSLKVNLAAGTLSANEKALLRELQRPLAYYTMAHALPGLSIKLDGMGMLVSSMPAYGNSENVESKAAANKDQMAALINEVTNAADAELAWLEQYLIDNAILFPGYTPPATDEYIDINSPDAPTYFV